MIDFEAEWKELHATRKTPDCSAHWTKKAARFDSKDSKNLYALDFVERCNFQEGETVFDMGCGTGAIAIPLARANHHVTAADFSTGMLEKLHENMEQHSLTNIDSILMSWEDDWEKFGITPNSVDVAVASRSIAVEDLQQALAKLTAVARKRCCITLATETTPRVDPGILKAIDVPVYSSRDFIYAFGMLAQNGFEPSVSYIHSKRKDTFNTHEEAMEDFATMIDQGSPYLNEEEHAQALERLSQWLTKHTIENPEAGRPDKKGFPQGAYMLDYNRIISWAFLTWDTQKGAF